MVVLPRLIRGQFGPIKFQHLNKVFDVVDRVAQEEVEEGPGDDERRPTPFFIRSQFLQPHPTAPFGNVLSWAEQDLSNQLLLGVADNGRTSTEGDDDFAKPAVLLTPPFGIAYVATDEDGQDQYVFQPTSSVFVAKITAVNDGPLNPTYDVKTVDDTILLEAMTPINRWAGINYEAESIGDAVQLLATGFSFAGQLEIQLVAYERPEITDCNKQPSGFGDSFIGF